MTVDCMTCLIQISHGIPDKSIYVDRTGITHAVAKWSVGNFVICTLAHQERNGKRVWWADINTVYI